MATIPTPPPGRVPRVGASVALWHKGAVLLIKRGSGPYAGKWALPGGHVRFGERMAETAKRELMEETGISAAIGNPVGIFEIVMEQPVSAHFVLMAFAATYEAGDVKAGDDAAEARWVQAKELDDLDITPQSRDAIARARPR